MNDPSINHPSLSTEPPAERSSGIVREQMTTHPVFVVDDSFFRSRTPKPVHWSIAWSDLMMTMFILFLCLFVYQLAHRRFLSQDHAETVAGNVMPVPEPERTLPIVPIFPTVSEAGREVLEKIEAIRPDEAELDRLFADQEPPVHEAPLPQEPVAREQAADKAAIPAVQNQETTTAQEPVTELPLPLETGTDEPLAGPVPAAGEQDRGGDEKPGEIISEIFDLSRQTLSRENLEKFAQVELIPDKAMRIVLTGDLLFSSGQAELSDQARESLRKLGSLIRQTPYLIHVIGHTDSVPMSSPRYPTNWELSTARASRVARFLIEEMQVPGNQIIVSGCSYFRPVRPNDTMENRRANRRVEIILSREEVPITATNRPQ